MSTFVPQVSDLKIAKILEINSESQVLKIELREDFRYIDKNEEEQMKLLNQDYLGSG